MRTKISFVDASGADKVKGLQLFSNNNLGYKRVDETQYKSKSSIQPSTEECNIEPLAVDQQKGSDFLCLDVVLLFIRGDYNLLASEVALTCAHIFGDDQPHKITMHWDKWQCTHVEYNGKSFPATKETGDSPYYIATIVLD